MAPQRKKKKEGRMAVFKGNRPRLKTAAVARLILVKVITEEPWPLSAT
jgi:hypothetical protein